MARTARALREEAKELRRAGWTYTRIASDWNVRYGLNPRVAMRLAHGLTQAQVADRWNDLWPEPTPRTAKHISYWEIWPEPGGRAPSLDTLNRLAMIYHCRAGDLLGGEDHTYLDSVAAAQITGEVMEPPAAATVQVLTVAIAIVRKDAEVLLVCRRDDADGSWQFPAGVVKPGAEPAVVAVRETLAETGVHCSVRGHIGRRLHPATQVMCEYFACDYLAGMVENLDPVENAAVTWTECAKVSRFIPIATIYPPVLKLLQEPA